MNNLLAGTGVGRVFMDLQLCILRFTPAATELINLIPGHAGGPVGHIVSTLLGYNFLVGRRKGGVGHPKVEYGQKRAPGVCYASGPNAPWRT